LAAITARPSVSMSVSTGTSVSMGASERIAIWAATSPAA
jgi:hypothetical protein